MSDTPSLAALTPQQRAVFELRLQEKRRQRSAWQGNQIVAQEPSAHFPLSFSQQRLWFVDQLEAGSYFYNVATAVRLSGRLRMGLLAAAFDEVVGRHESLRTTFAWHGGEPMQVIGPPYAVNLPLIDCEALGEEERLRETRRLAGELARHPFDLAVGPLMNCTLLRLSEQQHVLVCVMHHIISDWWSHRVLVRELALLYEAFSRGLPSSLPPLPIQYRDFAVWQRQWLRDKVLDEQLSYWRSRLAGAPTLLSLPLDLPQPAVQSFRGARQRFSLPPATAAELSGLCGREGCTLFALFLTALEVLLYRHSGQEDIVVSAPVSYRNWTESEGLIGFFATTLLLRGNLSGNPSLRNLLQRVHTAVIDDLAHQNLPLQHLIEELAPGRSLVHSPLLQVGINLAEDIVDRQVADSELDAELFDFEPGFSQFELNLVLSHSPQGVEGCFEYRTELFSEARIAQLVDEYRTILDAMLWESDLDLSQLVSSLRRERTAPAAAPVAVSGFRLSPQQERLCSLQREEGAVVYRALCSVEVSGQVEPERFVQALREVVERHEILRTSFQCLPGMSLPVQVVNDGAPLAVSHVDLGDDREEVQDEWLRRHFEAMSDEPIDLEQGPMLRVTLARLSEDRHVLFLLLPALCADAATLRILVAEIGRAAGAGEYGEVALQYADVAEWQNELLAPPQVAEAADLEPPVLAAALPFTPPADAGGQFSPRVCVLTIPPGFASRIDHLARCEEADAGTVLLAGWQSLLHRLAHPSEVATGVGVSGRGYQELERLLGPLTRYLPLRQVAGGEVSFAERVRRTAVAFREAADSRPDSDWRRMAQRDSGLSLPFSYCCFDFDELPGEVRALGAELVIDRWRVWCDRFRLKLWCARKRDRLVAELHFDAGSLLYEDVERLGGWYLAWLANALDAPSCPLDALTMLQASELKQLLDGSNATQTDLGPTMTLPELFTAQARRAPQAVALVSTDRRLTYAEVEAAADRLAQRLISLGAGPEGRIALCLERSPEMVIAILGILKSGAAYVPLDPDFPRERLDFMLEDSRAQVLVSVEAALAGFSRLPAKVLCLDREGEGFEETELPALGASTAPHSQASPESLAYVIYTSGSTGQPKGVMISHRAIANRLLWMCRAFPIGPVDTLLLKTPYSFDASIWEIFVPLMSGACLCIAEPGGHRDGAYLLTAIATHHVTILQLVPSQLAMLLELRELGQRGASLRRLFCGGEPLTGEAVRRFRMRLKAEVCNLYGPTETAIDATFHLCSPAEQPNTVPIGRPIANVQVYLLDSRFQPVPEGLAGELFVGGAGLARGYWMRPELTAERFMPHPFTGAPGQRLYRTGDIVRLGTDGELEFLGRTDHQVKVRGFRIELGEIEAALACHPGVAAAAVVVRGSEAGGRQLVAFYQAAAPQSPTPGELRDFLRASMPEHLVPAAFVALPALPLSPNGKVDRCALPEPHAGAYAAAEFVAPRTAVEQALASIWEDLLGIERVGAHDNFFDLGGHSLQGIRLVSHVRDSLGVELRVRAVFEAPTLAGLARCVTEAMVDQLGEELVEQLIAGGAAHDQQEGERA